MAPKPGSVSGIAVFRLVGQGFGLPVEDVREVVPVAWLDRPPHLSSMVEGILNLGGQAVPVDITVMAHHGNNTVHLTTDAKPVHPKDSPFPLSFTLVNLQITRLQ